jgi:hypothetical protein
MTRGGAVRGLLCAAALLVFVLSAPAAFAKEPARMALLIGNQGYPAKVGALQNPHNDVALLSKALAGLNFEVVILRDAGLAEMHRVLNAYVRRLKAAGPGAVGFFYYSGHGAADGNTNYIIPVDVRSTDTTELWDQSLRLNEITRKLKSEAANATHFVVFDACRNTLKLSAPGTRSGLLQAKGYVSVGQESGMLISYATAEGELASDEGHGAGLYARVLAEEIVRPGVEAVSMFRAVQIRVKESIGQDPWLTFPSLPVVYLAGLSGPPEVDRSALLQAEAERVWSELKLDNMSDRQRLEDYARQFDDTAPYWALKARQKIAMIVSAEAERRAAAAEGALKREELRKLELAKEAEVRRAVEQAHREAADDKAWSEVRQRHAFDGYQQYLAEFPVGSHRDEALDAIRTLEREYGLWAALKDRREFVPVTSFRDRATSRDLISDATRRLEELMEEEAKDWEATTIGQHSTGYRNFLVRWSDGPHSGDAKQWLARLEEIAARWAQLKASDNDSELEAFVSEHGWSEYGAEAAQRLVSLRKEAGKGRPTGAVQVLKAPELRDALMKGRVTFSKSRTEIRLNRAASPTYRKALGGKYLAGLLPEKVLMEAPFKAQSDRGGKTEALEGLAAIVTSQVDQTGSLFLLQMHGSERSGKDVDGKDRLFMTLHMLRTRYGLVCVGTKWQSLLESTDPERYTENCTVSN